MNAMQDYKIPGFPGPNFQFPFFPGRGHPAI